ncbi:MAG: DUF4166 domain-containing protein [Alphaproteobacteria bacterium]
MQAHQSFELIYDDQCPICRTYCRNIELNDNAGELILVDARQPSNAMDLVTSKGLDIDEGIVLKTGTNLYYGSEAIYQLSKHIKPINFMGGASAILFRSHTLSKLIYPVGKAARNVALRLLGIEKINNLQSGSTIRRQMKDEWHRLHPNIQARFARDPKPGEEVVYEGVMQTIRRTRMGWLFAYLTRVIGNPLTPHAGDNIPMEVRLFKREGQTGVFWQRTYHYPERKPYVVTSVKRESKKGEMMECVGGGFGMLLKLYEQDGKLHFESYRYFCQTAGLRIPLPHWLSPGKTHVVHEDLGEGNFKFTISMDHAQLGQTFYQEGIFHERQ